VNRAYFSPVDVLAIAHAFAGSPLQLFAWQTLKKTVTRRLSFSVRERHNET
jgi:hypothetical protein